MGSTIITSPSLAGTGRPYVNIQFRAFGNNIKVQGRGPSANRDYGVSTTVAVPSELSKWAAASAAPLKSLAGTEEHYIPAQAAILDDHQVRVQVKGAKMNRSYGAVFAVRDADLHQFVAQALAAASAQATAQPTQVEML